MQTYTVIIEELITREYSVEALSPDSAVSIAQEWKSDGEPGSVMNVEILHAEAYDNNEKPQTVFTDESAEELRTQDNPDERLYGGDTLYGLP